MPKRSKRYTALAEKAKPDAVPLAEAVAGYVEAISSQHGIRLEVLLAYTGLNGRDPIGGRAPGLPE